MIRVRVRACVCVRACARAYRLDVSVQDALCVQVAEALEQLEQVAPELALAHAAGVGGEQQTAATQASKHEEMKGM